MYLLVKDDMKIIVDTAKQLESMNIEGYEIYTLAKVNKEEIIFDGQIRDAIYKVLKGEQMSRDDVITRVQDCLGVSISRISKVINKMKKEKVIYFVDDLWDGNGNKWIGID